MIIQLDPFIVELGSSLGLGEGPSVCATVHQGYKGSLPRLTKANGSVALHIWMTDFEKVLKWVFTV